MTTARRCWSVNGLCAVLMMVLILVFGFWVNIGWAQTSGSAAASTAAAAATIVNATGTAHIRLPNGTLKAAFVGTELGVGDIISVEESSSVRIRFADGTELVLRPGTRLRIEDFTYRPDEPEADRLSFELARGGLRAVTGAIGRRGNPDAFQGRTLVGSIGVRGTQFGMVFCNPGECDDFLQDLPENMRDRIGSGGLFFEVTDGEIVFRNNAGEFLFQVGQWGFVADANMVPIVIDGVPFPIRPFLPLISRTQSVGGFSAGLGVDPFAQCEVR